MKEVRAKVFDSVLPVIDEMRGSYPRTVFLRRAISRGIRELHVEAMRNAPKNDHESALKQEGQMTYRTRVFADHMTREFERISISLTI